MYFIGLVLRSGSIALQDNVGEESADFDRRVARKSQSKRLETLCSLAVRAMASPISGAMEMRRMFLAACDAVGSPRSSR